MKISYQWLREWVPSDLSAAQAGEALTLAGHELESIIPAAPPLDGVVVGRIVSAQPHPDADRLQRCEVDVGQAESLGIVCGASNARAGLTVAVATIGTELPGGLTIRRSTIRGVESAGMLCAGGELGLMDTAGILELADELVPGTSFVAAWQLADESLDIALTPNRGDCLSLRGLAREFACITQGRYAPPFASTPVAATATATRAIHIESAADCRSYYGRAILDLDPTATTPTWMAERLRRSGLRSINPLVDVTNYVMLELGQPMHAFAWSALHGDIAVRRARYGESLTLLNDQVVDLSGDELVIADERGVIALAGVMGGLDSAVDTTTTAVFLESACFTPIAVAGTGRKFKLSSDALHRFERGVDPALQAQALNRASELLIAICGGNAGPLCEAVTAARETPLIRLRPGRLCQLLGSPIETATIERILTQLECRVSAEGETLQVAVPSHRYDLATEIDLVEEVARIYGFDRLTAAPRPAPQRLRAAPVWSTEERVQQLLSHRGYFEALSYSFTDPAWDAALCADPAETAIAVDNPMSGALAQMRRSLWGSLLPIWLYNAKRQQERIRLFELGREYRRAGDSIDETEVVAGIASGPALPEQWGSARRALDFYDLKGDVEALFGARSRSLSFHADEPHPALHPGQSAQLRLDGQPVGYLGLLHPALSQQFDLPTSPWLFAVSRDALDQPATPHCQDLPEFPSIRRDLALLVNQAVAADKLINYLKSHGDERLRSVRVFDVFTGDALPKGFKSVALGLIFQDFSRTLTDREVAEAVQGLTSGLEKEFGAQIRD